MAVAALILAIVPTCVGQLVAIGLGIGSLVAIGRPENRLKGKGLAIASLVVAGAYIVFLPMFSILAGMLLPALARARAEGRKAVCRNNLQQIGIAMATYAQEYGGWYPTTGNAEDGLGALTLLGPYTGATFEPFICPEDGDADRTELKRGGTLTEDNCSYDYAGPIAPWGQDNRVILWDKLPELHRGGRNVLMASGEVQWLLEEEFQRCMAAQQATEPAPLFEMP